jgi:SPP1 gp7 family putative phage head morphogenesis protein
MSYWQDRLIESQRSIADKTIEEIEAQLKIYYANAMKRVIRDFEATYNKLLATIVDGREPTPADLYKLDAYWQMQAQAKKHLERLGAREIALLSQEFEKEWLDVYHSLAIATDAGFNTVGEKVARAAINTVWLADGKHFSERIWGNTAKLIETLNEQLVDAVITGKTTRKMATELEKRFDVSYKQAKTLVRTEVAHIQVQAASQRYQDVGLTYYEFLGRDEHDIGCKCKQFNGKIFRYTDMVVGKNAPPLHPNCRCDIIPVVGDIQLNLFNEQ